MSKPSIAINVALIGAIALIAFVIGMVINAERLSTNTYAICVEPYQNGVTREIEGARLSSDGFAITAYNDQGRIIRQMHLNNDLCSFYHQRPAR